MIYHLTEPAALLGIALGVLLGAYVHDAVQVLAGLLAHDPMGRRAGKLVPRPERHLGIYSAVAVVLVGYGWTEQVPMNDRWRSRRWHVTGVLLSGPVVLAVLSLACLGGLRLVSPDAFNVTGTGLSFAGQLLIWLAYTFAALCVVSLIPLGPTDGARVLWLHSGTSPGWQKARHQLEERNIGLGLLLAILLLPVLFSGFPSVVGQLAPALVRGLGSAVGLSL